MEENKVYPKQNILSASENMKTEYCCNIIKVGHIKPIEGSDFLGQTFINGDSVVVRKDQVKEGDIFFFAMNECQLMSKFLKANSLYRDNNAIENVNYTEKVLPLKETVNELQSSINELKTKIKKLERARRFLSHVGDPESKNKFKCLIHEVYPDNYDFILSVKEADRADVVTESIELYKKETKELEAKQKEYNSQISRNCGFFEKNGRVRAIRLKGTPSFGYMFSQSEMAKAYPEIMKLNLEDYIGFDFDTVSGELFTIPYVPKLSTPSGRGGSKSKKAKVYEQMIDGEFAFHYDTEPLGKNIWKISPYDNVVISNKLHGSSLVIAHVKAKYPVPIKWYEKLFNKMITLFRLNKKYLIKRWDIRYAEIPSSRKVIKDPELNSSLNSGYYATDIWTDWMSKLSGKIPEDMTIYGEIIGYESGSDRMIQKLFDYGAKPGENFLMIYRITEINRETGEKIEWDVEDVYNWTLELIKKYPELKSSVHPIDIFYHGPFNELYPDIPVDNNWHDAVLQRMSEDKELFGMEELEPLCVNKVPREGLVIRVDHDKIPRAYKLKTVRFRDFEQKQIDAGEVDSEMEEGYSSDE